MKNILLIEDDRRICDVIQQYFNGEGTELHTINDGAEALEYIENIPADTGLVLLDIMLPNADGFTICRKLRRKYDIPVIFITARGREEDILYGYETGCDDYIVKPFSLAELYAKCTAFIKRSEGRVISEFLESGKIRLDTYRLLCYVGEKEVELPPKEFAILRYFMEHKNCAIDRNTLLDRIWGYDYFGTDRVVDNHIRLLRKALGEEGKHIKTVIGKGYRMSD